MNKSDEFKLFKRHAIAFAAMLVAAADRRFEASPYGIAALVGFLLQVRAEPRGIEHGASNMLIYFHEAVR